MRTLVHLSDIHFGRIDAAIIEPLVALVAKLKPDVVTVSGDLTQRARSEQFQEARVFLDRLPKPQIAIPVWDSTRTLCGGANSDSDSAMESGIRLSAPRSKFSVATRFLTFV